MWYLQRIKDSALVYRKSDQLEIIGYSEIGRERLLKLTDGCDEIPSQEVWAPRIWWKGE